MLQQWCIKNGWALVWSPGFKCAADSTEQRCVDTFFGRNGTTPFKSAVLSSGARRIIDPVVQQKSHRKVNVTVTEGTIDAFEKHWERVETLLLGRSGSLHALVEVPKVALNSSLVMNAMWWSLWQNGLQPLVPNAFSIRAVKAYECADVDQCIGVVVSGVQGECVCYTP